MTYTGNVHKSPQTSRQVPDKSRCHDHQWAGGFYIIIFSVAFVADDPVDIIRIALDRIVMVDMDADRLQLLLEQVGRWLSGVAGDDHAADVQSFFL